METLFSGVRAKWFPLYLQLKGIAQAELSEFTEQETTDAVLWKHTSTFAEVSPRKEGLRVGFASDTVHDEWAPIKVVKTSRNRVAHYFLINNENELPLMVERIAKAYSLTQTSGPPRERVKSPEYTNVDEYIAIFPPEVQAILSQIRCVIRAAAPDATEKLSWQMPTYHQTENLIHFAAFKNHIGIYPGDEAVAYFAPRLQGFVFSKGSIRLPLSKPIPYNLIEEITRHRVTQVTV